MDFKLENEIFGIQRLTRTYSSMLTKILRSRTSQKGRRDYLGDKKDVYELDIHSGAGAANVFESAKRYDNIIVLQCMENGVIKGRNISKQ